MEGDHSRVSRTSSLGRSASPSKSKSRNVKVVYKYLKRIDEDLDDGSQAWCIVLCCFLVNVLIMGFLKCLGILIIELMKTFKATQADVSILVSITTLLNCAAGPLACYLVVRFTARTIAFVGTLLVAVGLMLSWFAKSINTLYITIGVFAGFGSGLTYSPGVILIGNYFQTKRGMANGLVVTGSPVGGMMFPYLFNFLVRYLDCRLVGGALLILGGLMMNAVVCTLAYRPHRKPKSDNKIILNRRKTLLKARRTEGSVHIPDLEVRAEEIAAKKSLSESDDSSGPEFIEDELNSMSNSQLNREPASSTGSLIVYKVNERYGQRSKSNRAKSQKPLQSKPPLWPIPDPTSQSSKAQKLAGEKSKCKSVFISGTGQNVESKQSQTHIHPKKVKPEAEKVLDHPFTSHLATSVEKIKPKSNLKANGMGQSSSPTAVGHLHPGASGEIPELSGMGSITSSLRNRKQIRESGRRKDPPATSTKKLSPYILSLDHSCVIMWSNEDLTRKNDPNKTTSSESSVSLEDVPSSGLGDGDIPRQSNMENGVIPDSKMICCSRRIRNWIRNSPLQMPSYLILLFSNATTAIATTNILLLIPSLSEYRGLSKAEYSTVYLVISVTDMSSRLLGAFMSDRGLVSSKLIFSAGLIFAGLSSLAIAFCDTFLKMCLLGSAFGISSGFHIGIYGTLLAEIVGIELLHVGYAISMILNGVLQFSFINISGLILSADPDSFTSLYVFYGVTLLFGGLLWLLPTILLKVKKKKDEPSCGNINGTTDARKARSVSPSIKSQTAVALSNMSL